MRAAQIKDGVVVNFAEVNGFDHEFIDPLDAVIGSTWDGEKFIPPAPAPILVPESVSPRQIRQALTRAGLRTQVEAAVAAGDQDTKDWYAYATVFERANPHVVAMGTALNVTTEQLDDLWTLAATL